jgi:ferritin-like metal-binding protein YciE
LFDPEVGGWLKKLLLFMQRRTSKKQSGGRSSGRNARRQSTPEGEDNALRELFLDELADLYNAEQQLTKALPKLAKAADSEELREAIQNHLEETRNHVTRLEDVAEQLNEKIKRKTCKGMEGLIEEGEELVEEMEDSPALDAAIIASAQKVEHYEIAAYGTLRAWAERLGHEDAAQTFEQTQAEEEAADEKLTSVAESVANEQAQSG